MNSDSYWEMSLAELKLILDKNTLGLLPLPREEQDLVRFLIEERNRQVASLERLASPDWPTTEASL